MSSHPDPIVAEVLDVWTPRFLVSGVYYYDLMATAERTRTWDDWCPQWIQTGAMHESLAEQHLAEGHPHSAAQAYQNASACYHTGGFVAVRDAKVHRAAFQKMLDAYWRGVELAGSSVEKLTIPMGGGHVLGLLTRARADGKTPVVVAIPGLDSTKEGRHRGAEAFVRRGVSFMSVEGPGQGEMSFTTHIEPDYERTVAAVMDYIETQPDLDSSRVALWGASLGGYYAPRAAAYEKRVYGAAGNCGPYNWGECWDQLPLVTREAFQYYSGSASEPEARERAYTLTLEGAAGQIECPLLIVHGKQDPLIPWQHAERIVAEAQGPKELTLYDEGNHSCNNIPYKANPRQVNWLIDLLRAQ